MMLCNWECKTKLTNINLFVPGQTNSHCFQLNQNFEKVGQCQESLYFAIYFQFSLLTILHVGSTLGDGGCKTNTQIYLILPTNAPVRSTPESTLIIKLC